MKEKKKVRKKNKKEERKERTKILKHTPIRIISSTAVKLERHIVSGS